MKPSPTPWQIWGAPLAIGIASAVGLTAALLSDGPGDLLSWITLSVPVLVALRYSLIPSSRRSLPGTAKSEAASPGHRQKGMSSSRSPGPGAGALPPPKPPPEEPPPEGAPP